MDLSNLHRVVRDTLKTGGSENTLASSTERDAVRDWQARLADCAETPKVLLSEESLVWLSPPTLKLVG